MAHFGKDILITAWLFRLLIGGVSRVRAGVKWSLRNSRYIKLLQKLRVATYAGGEMRMGFKIILFVFAVFVPITIFGIAKTYCDWADAQEKRKEAAKWNS